MRGRRTAALTGSPVLVGSITLLVTIVAVFIAYNANAGLPFVPTYDVRVELPNASKLVVGNDVRAGGFRVGVVDQIRGGRVVVDGEERSIAVLQLKLDKTVEPLPADTLVAVRSRSALGLKYVELVPGSSARSLRAGDTIPLGNSRLRAGEIEDFTAIFDDRTRVGARAALEGFGSALAGRGPSVNRAILELVPLLRHLEPVARNLSDPRTELSGLFPRLGRALGELAPVAMVQPELLANQATTFGAIGRDPQALREAIAEGPPTLRTSIRSLRVQTPFLARFADLSRAPDGHALGTLQRILSIPPSAQENSLTTSASSRPVDVPPGTDPQAEGAGQALHSQQGGPAVDSRGRADCQSGQWGYLDRLATDDRYGPNRLGGAHIVVDPNTPGLAGGTWVSRRLGIDNVRDVP
jgi:ABC-type transporter Mla subunit MlaD